MDLWIRPIALRQLSALRMISALSARLGDCGCQSTDICRRQGQHVQTLKGRQHSISCAIVSAWGIHRNRERSSSVSKGEAPRGLDDLLAQHSEDVTVVRAKGFEAFDFATELLVVLGPAVVVQIGSIIKTHLESSRQVRIKVDGVEIEGVKADEVIELLEQVRSGPTSDD